jgi:two-component system response regulator PhoP
MHILVVEDDPAIRATLAANLSESGFQTAQCASAREARSLADSSHFDAMIVDVGLPEGPDAGFDLVAALRGQGQDSSVLFLSARDGPQDRARARQCGGDDYLTKPFHLSELHRHLRALLNQPNTPTRSSLERGDLSLDFVRRTVRVRGQAVHLSSREYALLAALASSPGHAFSRAELRAEAFNELGEVSDNGVDAFVTNIRRKVGAWVLEDAPGGYRFPE